MSKYLPKSQHDFGIVCAWKLWRCSIPKGLDSRKPDSRTSLQREIMKNDTIRKERLLYCSVRINTHIYIYIYILIYVNFRPRLGLSARSTSGPEMVASCLATLVKYDSFGCLIAIHFVKYDSFVYAIAFHLVKYGRSVFSIAFHLVKYDRSGKRNLVFSRSSSW